MAAEFDIISRYFARRALGGGPADGVVLGIGDDAALVRPEPGTDLVVATDTLVEGIHFPPGTPPADVGWRALAVNLSDLAAMGVRGRWALLALTVSGADETWFAGFSDGFFRVAEAHGVALVGGDTSRGPTSATVTLLGTAPPLSALRRGGARVGDLLYVTGHPGDAAGGLRLLCEGENPPVAGRAGAAAAGRTPADILIRRFLRPTPRVDFGVALRESALASAAIDVSDGLLADAAHIARASGLSLHVQAPSLPLSAELTGTFGQCDARQMAQSGGDDYELLLTCGPGCGGEVEALARRAGLPCTLIGEAVPAGPSGPGVVLYDGTRPVPMNLTGYEHFER